MKLKVKWIMYKNVSENTGLFPVVLTVFLIWIKYDAQLIYTDLRGKFEHPHS